MNVEITPCALGGTIPAISSKSDAHRLLIAAALADEPTVLSCNVLSDDIRATADCLCALGAHVEYGENQMTVTPIGKSTAEQKVQLDCGESGSTLRFLLPVVSALGKNGVFSGHGRLPERPVTDLRNAMAEHGVTFSPPWVFPIETAGKLSAGKFTLKGNVSSQYVTGLLFALPLLSGDSEIELLPPVESKAYIDMTLSTLQTFGISVEASENTYKIRGGQTYKSPGTVTVDGDWSNAAFYLTAGALGAPVTVTGLKLCSVQGDKAILDILRQMGAHIEVQGDVVTVSPAPLHGVSIDASGIPDLVPILSVAAAACETGVTTFTNAARLRIKECDRLAAINECLTNMGVVCAETDDGLVVWGGEGIRGGNVFSFNDHRMVMSMAIAATAARESTTVREAQAVKKSYPHFFADFEKLGGKANVLDIDG